MQNSETGFIPREEFPIESLLSGRQFLEPQISGDKIYFIGNLAGRYSLYVMDKSSSIFQPMIQKNALIVAIV